MDQNNSILQQRMKIDTSSFQPSNKTRKYLFIVLGFVIVSIIILLGYVVMYYDSREDELGGPEYATPSNKGDIQSSTPNDGAGVSGSSLEISQSLSPSSNEFQICGECINCLSGKMKFVPKVEEGKTIMECFECVYDSDCNEGLTCMNKMCRNTQPPETLSETPNIVEE